jgi:hypothetical protein
MTLADLHVAIQVVMGWENSHLHAFDVEGQRYSDPDMLDNALPEHRLSLKGIKAKGIKRFRYTYDFGDSWEHTIDIEDKPTSALSEPVPVCVAGRRAGPPDDSGGVWGYEDMLDVLAKPEHPDHAEIREWVPEGFDPAHFSVEECNAALKHIFAAGRQAAPA